MGAWPRSRPVDTATSLIIFAYRTGEAAVVAPMQYSQIVWATAFGWLVFAELPDAATRCPASVGIVIITAGVYERGPGRRCAVDGRQSGFSSVLNSSWTRHAHRDHTRASAPA